LFPLIGVLELLCGRKGFPRGNHKGFTLGSETPEYCSACQEQTEGATRRGRNPCLSAKFSSVLNFFINFFKLTSKQDALAAHIRNMVYFNTVWGVYDKKKANSKIFCNIMHTNLTYLWDCTGISVFWRKRLLIS